VNAQLGSLGLVPFFLQQLTEDERATCHLVRVMATQRSIVSVSDGEADWEVPLTGAWHGALPEARPTIGDWVLLDESHAKLVRVLDRKTVFRRVAAGNKANVQLIAANIDALFILTSCNDEFNESRLERYVALAAEAGVIPVIVLTKTDLIDDAQTYCDRARTIKRDIPVEAINALDGGTLGGIRAWLAPGTTVTLVGSSGVGKSTLVNTLLGKTAAATGGIREDDARGRHTTSHRSIHRLPEGGLLADVPGMRELKVAELDTALHAVFDDIERLAKDCRFMDCRHESEPGCAVRRAVEDGTLEERRWRNFLKLAREDERNSRSLAERHAHERVFGKVMKNMKALRKDLGLKR
jgi:ribosome biogenesis GTPase